MAVDFLTLFQSKYPSANTAIYVDQASGNDGNPGTPSLPKATIPAGVSAVGSSGKVWVRGNGTYGAFSINGKNGTISAHVNVMAEPGHSPKIQAIGNQSGVALDGCSYLNFYGFEVFGQSAQSAPYNNAFELRSCHHVAIWKNYMHDTGHGVGAPGNFGKSNNITIAYNICGPNLSRWLPEASSAISLYSMNDGGNAADGFSNRIIGNICYDSVNELSTAASDGNGIIVDACNASAGQGGLLVNDKTLIAFNLTVSNGARGIHAFMSDNPYIVFNTIAHNVRSAGQGGVSIEQGEATTYGSNNGMFRWNAISTRTNRPTGSNNVWFQGQGWDGSAGNIAPIQNTVMRGSNPALTNNYDKTGTGDAYWQAPNDVPTNPAGWRPVSTTQQTVDLGVVADGNTIYTALATWPDFFGDYRPTNKVWSTGFTEATPGSGGGGAPVANFSYTPVQPAPGQAIAFLDLSTNVPTSWAWNFGDGTTSTQKNPAKTYAQAGTYNVSMTATNGSGSNGKTVQVIVGTVSTTTVWYEAETAAIGGGAEPPQITTTNPGFVGSGYVGFFGRSGNYVDFTIPGVAAGQYSLLLRWGKGEPGTASRDVVVNGATIATPSLNQSASDWSDPNRWQTSDPIIVNLVSGSNTIRIAHSGSDYNYADLDRIGLTPVGTPTNVPVANFTHAPTSPTPGGNIAFSDLSTGNPTAWAWNFGDGTTSTQRNPVKAFALVGSYVVQLTATNSVGSGTVQRTIIVTSGTNNPDPVSGSITVSGTTLLNSTNYTARVQVRDTNGLIGEDIEDFATSWSAPAVATLTVTASLYATSGYVKLEWTESSKDANYVAWRIYRRTTSPLGAYELVTETRAATPTFEYHDWLAKVGTTYEYALVQVATRFGQEVESAYTPVSPVTPVDDRYWLIDPNNIEANNVMLHVTADDFQGDQEVEVMQLIGRGRRMEFGTNWGKTGTLSAHIRNDGIDTPKIQRYKIEQFVSSLNHFYLRTPFGDVWKVTMVTAPMSRMAGVGTEEMIDVELAWQELTA